MKLTSLLDAWAGKAPLGVSRSSRWPKARAAHLAVYPFCAVCNGKAKLEVHHIKPFHEFPELELVESNMVTLCESGNGGVTCHLHYGHLGNYKNINPDVLTDIPIWRVKLDNAKPATRP